MRTDVLRLRWQQDLTAEQKHVVDTILREHCTVSGPVAFGGPWSYIVPENAAKQVYAALGKEEQHSA